jgi:hypothetical protein
MAHVRTQIRDEMASVLSAALGSGYRVYASRKYPQNLGTKALIDMRFLNENIEQTTMGDERTRTASLCLRCNRGASETTIDNLLDADEVAIHDAIMAHDWSDLLEEQPELIQVNFSDDAGGGTPIGAIVLRFDLEYRVSQLDLETVRD